MTWINEVFHKNKAIIGMCHLKALPGDPLYDAKRGMEGIYQSALQDVNSLQLGGIDGIQFTNEFSVPYEKNDQSNPVVVAAMATIIGRLKEHITVPFGVNCIGDSIATISLCAATGATWTRGTYYGSWATNEGIVEGECAKVYRLRHNLNCDSLKLIHYIVPENSKDLADRDPITSLKSHCFLNQPDALGLAGLVAGQKISVDMLKLVRNAFPDIVLFTVTGINETNVKEIMTISDAAFVGTSLKYDGIFNNQIDVNRVKKLMALVKDIT